MRTTLERTIFQTMLSQEQSILKNMFFDHEIRLQNKCEFWHYYHGLTEENDCLASDIVTIKNALLKIF